MVNERKTEGIIRDIFRENKKIFEEEKKTFVYLEEQQSDNPKIKKLLKSASKKGSGVGYPEFIITFQNSDLLIVLECKADQKYHKSNNLDKYSSHAVDGALLYSFYLSKEYNVVAIGVSGERKNNLIIDTFLQLRGEKKPRDLDIHKIYDFEDYFNILKQDEIKEKLDYENLIKYSKTLNKKLKDDFEFEENLRPLIVSGILLALEDESFCSAYPKKQSPLEIAGLLITAIRERLEHDNIGKMKANTMIQTYNFLKTNTNIITTKNKDGSPNELLKNLISDIEENVKPFLKDYQQYDIIGQFYNEFLRYANGDGGLGIVLTPKHITELFTDLAEISKDSVVLDNCCGTGGFLISSMKRMEDLAKGNSKKINNIHEKQILGIENNPKMFCLACSNMMLRGDGKSNIHQQNCFQIKEKEITEFKPNVALLNPPYSKENGHKELEFVWNALNFLEPHGICVAIVPQSCAMNTKKGNLNVKKRLLENHTLRAVMSMPDNLFDDSEKSSVTCVLVFEAHKPHNFNTETWFGYWKEDGFLKSRPFGRVDYYGKYKKEIKPFWLNAYHNKKEIEGFSILKKVDGNDEWLVEPYIKTNFSKLKDEDFENTLKEFNTFLYYNTISENASSNSYKDEKLKLNLKKWKKIKLKEIFDVVGSKTTDKKVLDYKYSGKGYPYVTTQSTNNGVRDFYDFYTEKGNVLTIDSAVAGFCAYQPFNFSASDHVEKLIPKFQMNVYRGLFLATLINKEQYRYSYGRKFNQDRIRETIIKLPFKDNKIDWEWIDNYIKGLKHSKFLEITLVN